MTPNELMIALGLIAAAALWLWPTKTARRNADDWREMDEIDREFYWDIGGEG